ncbi:hypothetical protein, partial [Thiolapillus sp.]|uniref:hypothetical protein n=1 Tax=Thiolapillus sp. TaxID=2017437 RepID=UPI003AF891F2
AAFGCLLCFPSGAMRTTGKQCGLAATGVYQPSLRSPWLAASDWPEKMGSLYWPPILLFRMAMPF